LFRRLGAAIRVFQDIGYASGIIDGEGQIRSRADEQGMAGLEG